MPKTIEQLRREITRERSKVNKEKRIFQAKLERKKLETELKELKNPSIRKRRELFKRLGRGLKITGKKVGRAIRKQAILIKEQQERDNRTALRQNKKIRIPKKRKKMRKKKRGGVTFGDIGTFP